MQRRQLEAGDAGPGGGARRSRLIAACYALAVRLGCAARELHGGGVGGEGGPDAPVLASELARAYQEKHGTPPHVSATAPAAAPHAGGVGAVSPRYIPSTLHEQVWGAKRHATRFAVTCHSHMPGITSNLACCRCR